MSIKTYTVHHRSSDPATILREPDRLDFVKEGFSWPAFFVPFLWLLYKRMWLVLVLFLVVSALVGVAPRIWPLSGFAQTLLGLGVNLVMGFQGNDLLRWTLARRGRREVAIVMGDGISGAEQRFFDKLCDAAGPGIQASSQPVASWREPQPLAPTPVAPKRPTDYSILPEPGRV